MEDNIVWGYNAIYGERKPEYHESFSKDMRDALNYLCARVRDPVISGTRCTRHLQCSGSTITISGTTLKSGRKPESKGKKSGGEKTKGGSQSVTLRVPPVNRKQDGC